MARITSTIGVGFLALTTTFLYTHRDSLNTFYANRPGSLKDFNILPNAGVEHEDVVRNCEDVYMDDVESWAVLSCDPGRDKWNTVLGIFTDPTTPPETGLYLSRYSADDYIEPQKLTLTNFSPGPADFHPLGITYDPGSKSLFVVNHAASGTRLETFRLNRERLEAKHIASISDPLLGTANSVVAVNSATLLVSNDHFFARRSHGWLATLETYLALPLASLVRVDLDITRAQGPPKVTVLARLPFANGVAVLNGTTVAVASTARAAVYIYTSPSGFAKGTADVKLVEMVRLQFLPDNLSVDSNGALLIAGHPFAPALEARARAGTGGKCGVLETAAGDGEDDGGCPVAPSWVAEWTAEGGMRDLFVGRGFGSATTAVRDVGRGRGMVVGLYDRGVLTWSETEG
ncbi:hypothetical protein LTR91_011544 [Friedmanniomyces endolithicus]|uniref:Calcium-dependent phosphotriesterase n=2 Tax=Dothideomycetidae TaxID=451867 RepID=A0AAN6KH99_9PEZI|nr:hypothetical protein LTR94_011616 [Friedmanniomyces endolithicus]KAK0791917.1 hypothetical protein LTR38_010042 [Friedmanniomyces endolithicus]KAK0806318.1 hypothetical protein LTR59_003731 [Friedmanniomyces endolithicus]KAK0842104.1 hypothetical protein LTR03_009511 [Friedmanniomyces endolithicus]KAK0865392.1 hypothetical protein LTS02_005373 [Friedmanniomyces endolithicus]